MPAPAAPSRRDDRVDRLWQVASAPGVSLALAGAVALTWLLAALFDPGATRAELEPALGTRVWWRPFAALSLDDPLGSAWFALLVAVTALAGLACALEHLPGLVRAALRPDRLLTDPVAAGLGGGVRIPAGPDPAAESARVAEALLERGFVPRTTAEEGRVYLFAERGRWTRFGPALLGLGLAVALAAGLLWLTQGWSGILELPSGGGADAVPVRRGALRLPEPLPFVLHVNDVEVTAAGAEARPRTNLSLLGRDGAPLPGRQAVDLVPGRPLSTAGVSIHADGQREDPGGPRAQITVVERASGRRAAFLVARGEEVQAGDVRFAVIGYAPRMGDAGAAAQIQRTEGQARTAFWVFQSQPGFDARNRPDRYSVEFQEMRKTWLTRLRLVHDPGAAVALWVGAALAALGLFTMFGGAHRRVWARVEPGTVLLAGASHRHSLRFRGQVADLAGVLAGRGPAVGS